MYWVWYCNIFLLFFLFFCCGVFFLLLFFSSFVSSFLNFMGGSVMNCTKDTMGEDKKKKGTLGIGNWSLVFIFFFIFSFHFHFHTYSNYSKTHTHKKKKKGTPEERKRKRKRKKKEEKLGPRRERGGYWSNGIGYTGFYIYRTWHSWRRQWCFFRRELEKRGKKKLCRVPGCDP